MKATVLCVVIAIQDSLSFTMANNYRIESVPLMGKGLAKEDHGDLTDQELDDLVQSPLEDLLEQMQYHPRSVAYKQYYRGVLFCSVLWFVLGSVISFLAVAIYNSSHLCHTVEQTMSLKFIDYINNNNIKNYLRELTLKTHLAGTPEEKKNAEYIFNLWKEYELDIVKMVTYDVLLSYPNKSMPNKISVIYHSNNSEIFVSGKWEKDFNSSDKHDNLIYPPFTAYSPSTIKPLIGNPVYVNYGRLEDFLKLKEMKININGCIAIIRYGKIFRGNKVKYAEQFGAAGVILYSDPKDYASDDPHNVYPHSVYLPNSGVQRGTLLHVDGDPTTPFYPSIKSAYRVPVNDSSVPVIPVHAISYYDAERIMSGMNGEVIEDWKGSMQIEYKLGPGYINPAKKLKMEIHMQNEIKTIYNVIGMIKGKSEPDRYVLIGNHRDSWTYGAVDPSSGTAAMLEISRVFGKLHKEGWKPRRTIIFCSWAAEEYGLIGSTEWVEENQKKLSAQAVAYLNVDIAVEGNSSLKVKSSPLLYQAVWDAAKKVANPNPNEAKKGRKTVYDTWALFNPWNDTNPQIPQIENLDDGSDYAPFFHQLGIPSVDISYTCKKELVTCNPLYHTLYETFYLQDKLLDKEFHYHKAIAQIWGEVTRSLADSVILPFSVKEYATILDESLTSIQDEYGAFLKENSVSLNYLEDAIKKFVTAAEDFEKNLKRVDAKNPYEIRNVNDQLMLLERSFIDVRGLPGKPFYRHVIFSPSIMDNYMSSTLSGFLDLLVEAKLSGKKTSWEIVKEHLASVIFHINSASDALNKNL